ncbi:MAG: J domain-containing protein [Coriobacteriales bacterium]|nr:J domain-containing protein [Coriobacteriales bacterium]
MSSDKNYYDVLGVQATASADEIKKAFKRLAREHHPDAGGDEAVFKEISEAYDTLSDETKRSEYDAFLRYGAFAGASGAGGGAWGARGQGSGSWQTVTDYGDMGAWGDIFSRISKGEGAFGTDWEFPRRKAKGRDVQVTLEVSFEEAFSGAQKRVTVKTGDGSSQRLDIKIPAGAVDGGKLRYKGKGAAGQRGGAKGDLVIVTAIAPHELYERKGADVLLDLPVTIDEAALGTSIVVPAPDATKVKLRVPAATQDGQVLVVKGKGAPRVKGEGAGDLKVCVRVVVPTELNDGQRAALEAFRDASVAACLAVRPQIAAATGAAEQ